MTTALYSLFGALLFVAFCVIIYILRDRSSANEYADGVEIPEEDIASAIEGDLRSFVADENARHCTGRLVNYRADEAARRA